MQGRSHNFKNESAKQCYYGKEKENDSRTMEHDLWTLSNFLMDQSIICLTMKLVKYWEGNRIIVEAKW